MKLLILTTLSLLFIGNEVTAQHTNIGIKGGLNAFTIKSDNSTNVETKLGYHIGLIGHIHISDQFALQPELVYSVQGARYTVSGEDVNLNLNYLNIPLLFQYMFDNGFRLQAGPQLGFLVSAKTEVNDNTTDVNDSFEKMDIGLGLGASYVNPVSNFGVDARYNVGLTNINDNSSVDAFNRGFQVGVFYLFKHKS